MKLENLLKMDWFYHYREIANDKMLIVLFIELDRIDARYPFDIDKYGIKKTKLINSDET